MGGAALGLLAALVEMVVGKVGILTMIRSDPEETISMGYRKGKIIFGSNCFDM